MILKDFSSNHLASIDGLQKAAELEWDNKYFTYRNWYHPEFYANAVNPWFLPGDTVPKGFYGYCRSFWETYLPRNYHVLSPYDITCPNQSASTGISFAGTHWVHGTAGDHWKELQDGAAILQTSSWIEPGFKHLDRYAICIPSYRLEGGPHYPRVVWITPKHLYIPQRQFMEPIQDQFLNVPEYIGKASNCMRAVKTDKRLYVGTNGDDWVIFYNGYKYTGDWSSWDLNIKGIQISVALRALLDVIRPFLSTEEIALFKTLAKLAVRRQVLWPWAKTKDEELVFAPSLRPIEGHVESGSGWFAMLNNCINTAGLKILWEKFRKRPVSFPRLSKNAWDLFGWVMKPESMTQHPTDFIASRSFFGAENGYVPEPLYCSLARNGARPNYDPEDPRQGSRLAHAARLRSLNSVLRFSTDDRADLFLSAIDTSTRQNGFDDPWGSEFTNAELALAINKLYDLSQGTYGMDAFLSS